MKSERGDVMSAQMKRSIWNLIIWLVVGVLFLIVFFGKNALSDWGDNSTKTLMLAILIGIGYSGSLVLSYIYRKRRNIIIADERDEMIQNKSMSSSFIATLVVMYSLVISIYIYYEKAGSVPVGWLWFIAYSLIFVANIISSSFSIYYHRKGGN